MKKYIYNVTLPNGCKDHGFCNSLQEIENLIPGAKYYSLCLANENQTDVKSLVCWFGAGGFWYNKIHENEFLPSRLCTTTAKEKEIIISKEMLQPFVSATR